MVCSSTCFKSILDTLPYKPLVDTDVLSFIPNNDKEKYYKSSYELRMIDILSKLGIEFEYERYLISIWIRKDRRILYLPDFYLPKHGCFLEVKGEWKHGAYRKVKTLADAYPIYVITRDDLSLLRA